AQLSPALIEDEPCQLLVQTMHGIAAHILSYFAAVTISLSQPVNAVIPSPSLARAAEPMMTPLQPPVPRSSSTSAGWLMPKAAQTGRSGRTAATCACFRRRSAGEAAREPVFGPRDAYTKPPPWEMT